MYPENAGAWTLLFVTEANRLGATVDEMDAGWTRIQSYGLPTSPKELREQVRSAIYPDLQDAPQ
jgi:hypothetical protein